MIPPKRRAVFIDKDGTLIPDIPYNVNPELIEIDSSTLEGLALIKAKGFLLIIVSNQSGVAKGYFKEEALQKVGTKISDLLRGQNLQLDGFYYCPHSEQGIVPPYTIPCDCRKPEPGMLLKAATDLYIDLEQSWMIGDILNDVEAGNRARCRSILIDNGNETEWRMTPLRQPDFTAQNVLEAALRITQNAENLVCHE